VQSPIALRQLLGHVLGVRQQGFKTFPVSDTNPYETTPEADSPSHGIDALDPFVSIFPRLRSYNDVY
jgi:hypothetical protein